MPLNSHSLYIYIFFFFLWITCIFLLSTFLFCVVLKLQNAETQLLGISKTDHQALKDINEKMGDIASPYTSKLAIEYYKNMVGGIHI